MRETTRRPGSWQFEVTPYLWATGLDGTLAFTARPQAGIAVQQSFSDLFKILDFAASGSFEARNGRWGVLFDAVYFKLSDTATVTGPRGFATLAADGTVTQQIYTLLASYRVSDGPSQVDLFGGLRYASVEGEVEMQATLPQLALGSRSFGQKKHWVDPVIGARIRHPVGERWTLVGYADIGGFGTGSDLSWQLIAGANYAFSPKVFGKMAIGSSPSTTASRTSPTTCASPAPMRRGIQLVRARMFSGPRFSRTG